MANKCVSCNNCGHVGWSKNRGNFLITIVLAFFFLIPAVIYEIWRRSGLGVCESCSNDSVKPSNQCTTEKPSDLGFLILPTLIGLIGAIAVVGIYALINGGPNTDKTIKDFEDACTAQGMKYYQDRSEYPMLPNGEETSTKVLNDCKGNTTGKYTPK